MPIFFALSARLAELPEPGKTSIPIGRDIIEHLIVALERRRLGVARPVGLECDLRYPAVAGPRRGDGFGALRAVAMQQDHVGMFGVDLIEPVPDHVFDERHALGREVLQFDLADLRAVLFLLAALLRVLVSSSLR
jgi:hypothetical protein